MSLIRKLIIKCLGLDVDWVRNKIESQGAELERLRQELAIESRLLQHYKDVSSHYSDTIVKLAHKLKKSNQKATYKVHVEQVSAALEFLRSLDRVPLKGIKWVHKGQDLQIDSKQITEFSLTGLAASDFVECCILGRELGSEEQED